MCLSYSFGHETIEEDKQICTDACFMDNLKNYYEQVAPKLSASLNKLLYSTFFWTN